jgi:hypothetical protein
MNNKKRVAIVFFGLTRTLTQTIDSIKNNIFNVLTSNNMEYDIFIHTYEINGIYKNDWSNENTKNYKNEDIVSLLSPKYFLIDKQEDIINSINFNSYYSKLGNWTGMSSSMTKYLIRNMILALYSKNKIIKLLEQYKSSYDFVIITRPDMEYLKPIDISYFNELTDNNIIIPEKDGFLGLNDRMCICKMEVALYYGSLYNNLLEYSKVKSIISEVYLNDMLKEKNILVIKKNINYDTLRIKSD